jgi:hypothetical protein
MAFCFRSIGKFARLTGIKLRQSYARKAKAKNWQASGYAAARQFGRLKQANQDLKNWLGRIVRDIENKRGNKALSHNFTTLIGHAIPKTGTNWHFFAGKTSIFYPFSV